jgi:hypothetical protein
VRKHADDAVPDLSAAVRLSDGRAVADGTRESMVVAYDDLHHCGGVLMATPMMPPMETAEPGEPNEPGEATEPNEPASIAPTRGMRTERRRKSFDVDHTSVAKRVIEFADRDMQERAVDRDRRLQRYAKYRQWTSGKEGPWEDSSDQAIPDMMTSSLRTQDTIHNAVMSARPVVVARAIEPRNQPKQDLVDDLLDSQFFIEQNGEGRIGEAADLFTNDGVVTWFVPWVREKRGHLDVRVFDDVPFGQLPIEHFKTLLERVFPKGLYRKEDDEGWDWTVFTEDGNIDVSFYTTDDAVEMVIEQEVVVFDGPCPIVKDYEDVLHPHRCANLQIPGPSNPDGATHVILVDHPTIDEIRRLVDRGFYDIVSDENLKKLGNTARDTSMDTEKRQKDSFQGTSDLGEEKVVSASGDQSEPDTSNRTVTRYMCFDSYDVDKDGLNEDVIFWVIREGEILLKAKRLTEMYPFAPPRRPLAESNYLEVKGRRTGLGLLEMMEGLHDWLKEIVDWTMDSGQLQTMPFGFYRPTSAIKSEVYRMWPGDLMPALDPKNDVYFPTLQNTSMAFGLNMLTVANQMEERLSAIGDLQMGRVPNGKASALRTLGGIQTILGQGEARPERVLRRFFMGLTDVFRMMHELNRKFLPERKRFRIAGYNEPGKDPYKKIEAIDEIDGDFTFDFNANVMNSSKGAVQEALSVLMPSYINPLTLQLGVIDPDGIYRMLRDYGRALGQNADRYLKQPTPGADSQGILAEEAISMILRNEVPNDRPIEGAAMQMQRLMTFAQSDQFGLLKPGQVELFKQWLMKLRALAQQEAQQQKMMEAAAAFQQAHAQQGGGGGTRAPGGVDPNAQAPVGPNELMDESLPTAGGGANP